MKKDKKNKLFKAGYRIGNTEDFLNAGNTQQIINQIEKEGCSCDLLYGYCCGIHRLIKELNDSISY